MYCYAALGLVAGNHGLVHMLAIHAFAAIFWQEGRMNIDNAVWKVLQQVFGYQQQESCKDDVVNLFLAQVVQHCVALVEVVLVEIAGFHAQAFGTLGNLGLFAVVDNACHINILAVGKIFAYTLGIGAVARPKDCKLYRCFHYSVEINVHSFFL